MRALPQATSLDGVRIGVLREYMDKRLFTQADHETIDIVEQAVDDLRRLGATIVDPGPEGALFQTCIDQYVAHNLNALFIKAVPGGVSGGRRSHHAAGGSVLRSLAGAREG